MSTIKFLFMCFLVTQSISDVVSARIGARSVSSSCTLPPHPSSGWWSYVTQPSQSSSGLTVPENTVLRINCEDTYKLNGGLIVACIAGIWMPKIGKCLKTCPDLYSTSTLNVTCVYKSEETINCTEPVEGTMAQFKCASFYEDTRLFKSKAVCVGGKWSANTPQCTPVCGRTGGQDKPTLIVGGQKAKKGEFPWQIAIYTVRDKVLICGGTLLSERVVLTAAHCISDDYGNIFSKDQYVVVAGKYYRKYDHPGDQQDTQVSEIHDLNIFERYEGEEQNYEGDIAVIITKVPFKFSATVQPVCIDWEKKFENVVLGTGQQKGYVSGWGYTKQNSDPANELRRLSVPSIPRKECRQFLPEDFRRFMTHDKFCAGYKNQGASVCHGDSGGGLVFKGEGRFFIAGIVSVAPSAEEDSGGGCDSQRYTVFTLVYNYTDNFILKKLAEFKSLDTSADGSKESFVNSSTTEIPTTIEPLPFTSECILPQHPESGQWTVVGSFNDFSPGSSVSSGTIIKFTCETGYRYNKKDLSMCFKGTWSSTVGRCLKMCQFSNLQRLKATCFYNDQKLENCTDALDGTIAKFECDSFYEFRSLVSKPSVCLNGEWSFVPECEPACGRKADNLDSKDHHPWHVTLYKNLSYSNFDSKRFYEPFCEGNLISTRIVVSVALCLSIGNDFPTDKNFIVVAGIYNRKSYSLDDDAQHTTPEEVLIPRQYNGLKEHFLGDIALIILKKPFVPTNSVQPVCIDWSGEIPFPFDQEGFLGGWTEDGSLWKSKEHKFQVIPLDQCALARDKVNTFFLSEDKFCGRLLSNDASLCFSSYGAGLVFKHRSRYYLAGHFTTTPVSQVTANCDFEQYAIFTNVSKYTNDFILKAKFQ